MTTARPLITARHGHRSIPPVRRALAALAAAAALLSVWPTLARAEDRPAPPRPPLIRALLLNGGGSVTSNYLSHLHHLQDMAQALHLRGIPAERIDVFCSDGGDAKPDMVVRGGVDPDYWLIDGTALSVALGRNEASDTVWEGVTLHPARLGELRRWFAKNGRELQPGDTLFVFVTDHGSRNEDDPDNGFISLWNESLSVLDYRALLGHLRPGVRVVNVMSQCYSGAFADAMTPFHTDVPAGDVCGFYSTTRDRQAFGCYPEGRDRDRVGHAFHFIDAMTRHDSLDEAHDDVLVGDASPDAPIRTSDLYLERLLADAASRSGVKTDALVDDRLRLAWKDRARLEPEIRLLDRIGDVYGTFSPRLLSELSPHIDELQALSKELTTYQDRWKLSLDDLRRDNLQQFLDATPAWKEKIDPKTVNVLTAEQKKTMLAEVLPALAAFTRSRDDVFRRLQELRRNRGDAADATYRVDTRLAALARMRALLIRVAGLQFLDTSGDETSKRAFDALHACERSPVGRLDEARRNAAGDELVERLAPFEKDRETVKRVLPSWLGINFKAVTDQERERLQVARGAVVVQQVYPDSPALAAGLRPGDVVLGPPGAHFNEPSLIREWTMGSPRGTPLPLEILREDKTVTMRVSLAAFPAKIPALPAPPKEGDAAPALEKLRTVREGSDRPSIASGRRHMVFFWATWCGPCKSALPELMDWSARTGVPIVAVSDEDPETIRKFLGGWKGPFPPRVASDDLRSVHLAYGVSGTPTFVLVDEHGKIEWRQVGYATSTGLAIPGWTWSGRAK